MRSAAVRWVGWGLALALWVVGGPGAAEPSAPVGEPTPVGDAARGEILAGLGGCVACHTAPDGPPLAGGHRIETAFGTFLGPNLTPSEDGLAGWRWEDFVRAMREGRDPAGDAYWPAFPYASFRGMSDQDLADLWAWLTAAPPVERPNEPHEVRKLYDTRAAIDLWRLVALPRHPPTPRSLPRDGHRVADNEAPPEPVLERGAYLVDTVGHCGECHTPRGGNGAPRMGRYLGGTDAPPAGGPNLTPGALGDWTVSDLESALATGLAPDGDVLGGEMARVVREGTSRLSVEDRRAMATWILAQRPVRDRGGHRGEDEQDEHD
jgi:mono/diheme cytochrome c family protein